MYGVGFILESMDSKSFLMDSSREFVAYNEKVDINVVETIAKREMRFITKMHDFNMIRAYTGFRPFTEDHLPIVSVVDEFPGYVIAAGHEGDGISLATVTGKVVEELLQDKNDTIIPLEPLAFNRFKQKVKK